MNTRQRVDPATARRHAVCANRTLRFFSARVTLLYIVGSAASAVAMGPRAPFVPPTGATAPAAVHTPPTSTQGPAAGVQTPASGAARPTRQVPDADATSFPTLDPTAAAASAPMPAGHAGFTGIRRGVRTLALFDGKWVAAGETVRGARLLAVHPGAAQLRHANGTIEIVPLTPNVELKPRATPTSLTSGLARLPRSLSEQP